MQRSVYSQHLLPSVASVRNIPVHGMLSRTVSNDGGLFQFHWHELFFASMRGPLNSALVRARY